MTGDEEILGEPLLTDIFGPGEGTNLAERARRSTRLFVRGLDMLTADDRPGASGRRLTAVEAYEAYGLEKLYEVVAEGSAIISDSPAAAGRVLRERRLQLNLPLRTIASMSELSPNVIEALEASKRRPVREYERVARILGLDERAVSFRSVPEGNERVAVRLRVLADERPSLSSGSVARLAEAAWVAMTQLRLEQAIPLPVEDLDLKPSADYGNPGSPPFMVGYTLAHELREKLTLGDLPIASMRNLIEGKLGIPVIQTNLDEHIAGATVESNEKRAIVLNIDGRNSDALVRRSTLAHEVSHLLFDPSPDLKALRVDNYDELDERPDSRTDPVEQRANAFAIEFLAPQSIAVTRYERSADLFNEVLDYFGVSFTAGRYQVWNGLGRRVPLESIVAPNKRPEPDWDAREAYAVTYHPLRSLTNHPARAGRFSAVAIRSAQLGLISWDTVAEWLFCTIPEAQQCSGAMSDLYPEVFAGTALAQ